MERIAKGPEEISPLTINSDIVSDTEEWYKRKTSVTNKNQDQISELIKKSIAFDELIILKCFH